MIDTEAWLLYPANISNRDRTGSDTLRLERFSFADIDDDELLVEPLYGCWEGNMTHALQRKPVDICQQRGEERVVIGNAGVVRVLECGKDVTRFREGDYAIVFCNGTWDQNGFVIGVFAYDAPGTIGVLSKRTKLRERQLIPVPRDTPYSLAQWAAFSLRYITAWANWKVSLACWRSQMSHVAPEDVHVWAWSGGVSYAELTLARRFGYNCTMITSSATRRSLLADSGVDSVDRGCFTDMVYDPVRYQVDAEYRKSYQLAEASFLSTVKEKTGGSYVSIFLDNIGVPVTRASLRALCRGGVLTTVGWKEGMYIPTVRAIECMSRHIHVHTHYATYDEGLEAVDYASRVGWVPPVGDRIYTWNEIPELATRYANGKVDSLFPIFEVSTAEP